MDWDLQYSRGWRERTRINRFISLTLKFLIMSDEFMVALEPNQGHAYALLKELEENNSTNKAA